MVTTGVALLMVWFSSSGCQGFDAASSTPCGDRRTSDSALDTRRTQATIVVGSGL